MAFLRRVPKTYFERLGSGISEISFVFPNRRAGVFFRKYLSEEIDAPLFSPQILTIEQLLEQLSSLQQVDQTELLFRLFEVYRQVHLLPHGEDESFDNFVFWGRMMLSDFNDVDMSMANVEKLFANLSDVKDIEILFAGDSVEQRDLYKQFVESFSADSGKYHKRFMHVWRSMHGIYAGLRESLARDGLAYEGMLCRDVVEKMMQQQIVDAEKKYVFVGFNALSGVESELMRQLKEMGIAEFCWDYESAFLSDKDNRASLFMEDNLLRFGNNMPKAEKKDTLPDITLVEVPSETGEAGVVSSVLKQIAKAGVADWTDTGIVLPDEHLLSAVRGAVPQEVDSLNITMGQALKETPVMSLLQHLSELQVLSKKMQGAETMFYYKPVLALLAHPYVSCKLSEAEKAVRIDMQKQNMTYVSKSMFAGSELLSKIFVAYEDAKQCVVGLREVLQGLVLADDEQAAEKNEYLYQTVLQVNKLGRLLDKYDTAVPNVKTLFAILTALVSGVRVPFEGEPLSGLQIMGVLESRSMSFKNLIITDVNEDTLPGKSQQQTYIPYDLRRAYGLPTEERQDAVFAYNFYRLIAGAEHVWLIENTTANDLRSGEPSRYVYQLEEQYHVPIKRQNVGMLPAIGTQVQPIVEKDERVLAELRAALFVQDDNVGGRGLSPSALNTYVECPMKFYLSYVKHLRENDKITEETGADQFGTVLHNTMEELYKPFEGGKEVQKHDLEQMCEQVSRGKIVNDVYRRVFLKGAKTELEGKDMLVIHVLKQYVLHVLNYDKRLAPFRYAASEVECRARVDVENVGTVLIKGYLDRVDIVNDYCRVVDYKTGKMKSTLDKIENLFVAGPSADHVRQTLIYCLMLTENRLDSKFDYKDCTDVVPHIYYVKQNGNQLDLQIGLTKETMSGYSSVKINFKKALEGVITEIFDTKVPFLCKKNDNCKYCPFLSICGF